MEGGERVGGKRWREGKAGGSEREGGGREEMERGRGERWVRREGGGTKNVGEFKASENVSVASCPHPLSQIRYPHPLPTPKRRKTLPG